MPMIGNLLARGWTYVREVKSVTFKLNGDSQLLKRVNLPCVSFKQSTTRNIRTENETISE